MQQSPSASFAKQVTMPDEFPEILKDFTRECLRHQPPDINEFAVKYFDQKCNNNNSMNGLSASGEELSLDEIELVIQQLFKRYDDDNSGYLDRKEFRNLLNDLRTKLAFITEDDLYFFLSEADVNADNKIEYNEFIPIALQIIQAMYSKKRFEEKKGDVAQQAKDILVHGMDRGELERVLQNIFTSFDADGSGSLSRDEFVQALQSMELGLTRREINSVLFQYDRNDDGNISYTEFVPFAFDLLSKLTEMRIFETQMEEDELAQFLNDLFRAHDHENRGGGLISTDDCRKLLHQAKLGLTRLQIYSVLSVAEVNDEGNINYSQFVPKAVTVIRSMLNFESGLVGQVEAREIVQNIQDNLGKLESPSTIAAIDQCLSACCDDATKNAIMSAARGMGSSVDVKQLITDSPIIVKNMQKVLK